MKIYKPLLLDDIREYFVLVVVKLNKMISKVSYKFDITSN